MIPCYDASGDVTYDGINTYLYDAEGRICAVSSTVYGTTSMTGYIYDADGTRVAKGSIQNMNTCDPSSVANGGNGFQTISDYVLGPSGEQVTEMGMDSNNTLAWQHTNVYGAGKLMATYDNNGLHFYMDDPLGTRRAQTDYAGVLEQTCSSLPFGDDLACSGSTIAPTEHHFTGKERDIESGNDYFGARYYASSMGRFLSPDPLMASAHASNPQTWNRYAYVLNNPLRLVDPDGMDVSSKCANDKNCSITVKVNVILDKNAKSLTKADVERFKKDFLEKAKNDFGKSNINLQYTFTSGSLTYGDWGEVNVTGTRADSLNLLVTDSSPGSSSDNPDGGTFPGKSGPALSYVNIAGLGEDNFLEGPRRNNILVDSNVFEHELGQQFLGADSAAGYGQNVQRQGAIDPRNTFQGWGLTQSAYRTGLEHKVYSAPTNPEANKPQK